MSDSCGTCRFHQRDSSVRGYQYNGRCTNQASPRYKVVTDIKGYCDGFETTLEEWHDSADRAQDRTRRGIVLSRHQAGVFDQIEAGAEIVKTILPVVREEMSREIEYRLSTGRKISPVCFAALQKSGLITPLGDGLSAGESQTYVIARMDEAMKS